MFSVSTRTGLLQKVTFQVIFVCTYNYFYFQLTAHLLCVNFHRLGIRKFDIIHLQWKRPM